MPKQKTIGKKELKKFINENGFFYQMTVDVQKNAPEQYASKIPEGATYFEGVVSNGELNRNGYIIRPQALIDSLSDFMMNPVILLQHETDEPIGHCLSAQARGTGTTQDVFVQGYIFDDLTEGRFGRGLFRGLSTGHIPHEVEFENSKTGQVLSEEEFRKFNWEEQMNDDWIMCVTKLEWVEFSLVAIGSVRKALITSKNSIEAYLKNNKISANILRNEAETEVEEEPKEEEKEEPKEEAKEEEQKDDSKQPEQGEESANAGEIPAATTEEPVAKDGEGESDKTPAKADDKIRIPKADRVRLQNAADLLVKTLEATMTEEEQEKPEAKEEEQKVEEPTTEEKPVVEEPTKSEEEIQGAEKNSAKLIEVSSEIKNALQALVDLNHVLETKVQTLEATLAKMPVKKGLSLASQFNAPQAKPKANAADALVAMLRQNGFAV